MTVSRKAVVLSSWNPDQEGTKLPLLNVLGGDILPVSRQIEVKMIDINANINILMLDYPLSFRESRHSLPEK